MKTIYVRHDGKASASLLTDPSGDKTAILTEVAVWPEFRGRGWGSEILKEVCADADTDDVTLMLSFDPGPNGLSAEAMLSWYERYGFIRALNDPDVMIRLPQGR
ncbi:GNAT family N-acetyltransferase [Streptomyces sp. NPDC052020]|uniref:GNAT family N-acetyltransferase n=1 Tax=Streptomyces sp. NPDC052020 TaxID=3155677 RepID=UPI003434141A